MPETAENPHDHYTLPVELDLELDRRTNCDQCGVEGLYMGEVAVGRWLPLQVHVCTNAERAAFAASGAKTVRGACKGCGATECQQQRFIWRHHRDFAGSRRARLVFVHACESRAPRNLRVLPDE